MSLLQNMIGNATEKENALLTPKNVRLTAFAFCILCFVVGLFFADAMEFFLGMVLGGAMGQLIFWQNEKSVEKVVAQTDKTRAEFINRRDYYIRMALRAATVVIGYFNPYTNLVAVILGLFSITVAIYILTFISASRIKKESNTKNTESVPEKEEKK